MAPQLRPNATAAAAAQEHDETQSTTSSTSSSSAASTIVPGAQGTAATSSSTAASDKPRQPDPSRPGRTVAHKNANRAFLVHSQWKELRKDHEDVPLSLSLLRTLIKWILLAVLAALALGQFITGDVLYGYDGRWRYPSRWIPPKQRTFTPAELALYNGRDPSRPIYLSILGNVYDVTRGGSTYKPGGSYWFFAGKDASRAYVTGCFKTHLTHDLRGLGEEDLQQIDAWNTFFAENPRYQKVGTLQLPPIDPKTSPPEPCD